MSSGGKRKGAGRKPGLPTSTHPVRCTDEGWTWLQSQAVSKGHGSVGKWADSKGRKASKSRGTPSAAAARPLPRRVSRPGTPQTRGAWCR